MLYFKGYTAGINQDILLSAEIPNETIKSDNNFFFAIEKHRFTRAASNTIGLSYRSDPFTSRRVVVVVE